MPQLLTMAVLRNPQPAPPRRSDSPIIHTHSPPAMEASPPSAAPTGSAGADLSLHDRLQALCQASDWRQLNAIAVAHLDADGPSGPKVHPFTDAAVAFLRPAEIATTDEDLKGFLQGFGRDALKQYFAGPYKEDWSRLADHALALHCVSALGTAATDPISGLRAMAAFRALAHAVAEERPAGKPLLPRTLKHWGEAEVALPSWTFEIDVCGEPHLVRGGNEAEPTPLELKLDQIERMRAAATGNCDCKPPAAVCTPQSVCCPELKYYVADLLELRDWTHRYKAGDLAYIENVGWGELRMREHEMRRTREEFGETESSTRSSSKRDQQVTDSGTLKREIERQTSSKLGAEASVEGIYDNKVYKVTAAASLSYDKSASQAIKEAQEQARETVTSAVSELEKQVRTLRSERVTTEESEKNVHTWNNVEGSGPKVTKSFWVTQEKRAQLYSHGQRLMVELIVPSPARLHDWLTRERLEAEIRRRFPTSTQTKPPVEADLAVTAAGITRENYAQLAARQGVGDAPAPPPAQKSVVVAASYGEVGNEQKPLGKLSVSVPVDYHAVRLDLSPGEATFRDKWWQNTSQGKWIRFTLGGIVWFGGDGDNLSMGLANLTGQLSIDVSAANITGCQASITVLCDLDAAVFAAWQQAVFDRISAAHASKKAASEAALKSYEAALAERTAAEDALRAELKGKDEERNPFFNRIAERTELKRAAIYLMCQDFSAQDTWIAKAEPCGLTEIDRHAAAEHGYEWYFWDRLFDWKLMAYAFFDYFWNPICDWPERFDPKNGDAMFKAFLGAGYARLLVPVSKGMEENFLWYAASLQKWGQPGKPPLDPLDARWRNVLFELKYASENAMTPREGHAVNVAPNDLSVLIEGTDRYWDDQAGQPDAAAVAADLDRELFIDGAIYLVSSIQLEPGSPPYGSSSMKWRVGLDRPYEGTAAARRLYSMGAQAVAPAFSFDMPTELVWSGAHDDCLPTYPLPACP